MTKHNQSPLTHTPFAPLVITDMPNHDRSTAGDPFALIDRFIDKRTAPAVTRAAELSITQRAEASALATLLVTALKLRDVRPFTLSLPAFMIVLFADAASDEARSGWYTNVHAGTLRCDIVQLALMRAGLINRGQLFGANSMALVSTVLADVYRAVARHFVLYGQRAGLPANALPAITSTVLNSLPMSGLTSKSVDRGLPELGGSTNVTPLAVGYLLAAAALYLSRLPRLDHDPALLQARLAVLLSLEPFIAGPADAPDPDPLPLESLPSGAHFIQLGSLSTEAITARAYALALAQLSQPSIVLKDAADAPPPTAAPTSASLSPEVDEEPLELAAAPAQDASATDTSRKAKRPRAR